MLSDRRAEALGPRFAGQWLRLEDLEKVHPDRQLYPDFNQQLADAMQVETEMFFNHLVKEDRSALELFTSNYTFANEALAEHYGIPDVAGDPAHRPSDCWRSCVPVVRVYLKARIASHPDWRFQSRHKTCREYPMAYHFPGFAICP